MPRSFEHELETGGDIASPCFKDRDAGHAEKGVVYLDCAKTLTVIMQHPFRGQVIGIETSLPFLVRVAACADVEVHMVLTPSKILRKTAKPASNKLMRSCIQNDHMEATQAYATVRRGADDEANAARVRMRLRIKCNHASMDERRKRRVLPFFPLLKI